MIFTVSFCAEAKAAPTKISAATAIVGFAHNSPLGFSIAHFKTRLRVRRYFRGRLRWAVKSQHKEQNYAGAMGPEKRQLVEKMWG